MPPAYNRASRLDDPVYAPVATSSSEESAAQAYQRASGYSNVTPELSDSAQLLGPRASALYPAPSIMSRDSMHDSLHSGLNTPNLNNDRQSWGSGIALAAAAGGAGAGEYGQRPAFTTGPSNLGKSYRADSRAADSLPVAAYHEKSAADYGYSSKKSRKWLWIGVGVGAFLIVGLGIGLGVGLTIGKNPSSSTAAGTKNAGADTNGAKTGTSTATGTGTAASATPTTGGQGSTLIFEDGSTMTYENSFGGTWYWDETDPYNNNAKVNSWTPALNESWTWGVDHIYGVNLGGWLVPEPFIASDLFEKYALVNGQTAVDEYTLSQNIVASGDSLETVLENHYATFITEQDFAEIASAGLNWVRLPMPHWAIETWPGEPYLEGVSWKYVLKAFQWARKYGLRINLDMHTAPGSQNGWNHSGKLGVVGMLESYMGVANSQRHLDYVRTIAQFVSQPEFAPVVQMLNFLNEPRGNEIGGGVVGSFYRQAYETIRSVTGIGEGKGAIVSIHDAFISTPANWYGFLAGADRLSLDQHSYITFVNQLIEPETTLALIPCQYWAASTNTTSETFGIYTAGEWAAAANDCGYWLNGVGQGARFDGTLAGYGGPNNGTGACDYWNDYTQWTNATIASKRQFVEGSMDALQDWFFWTWKINNSTGVNTDGVLEVNPSWHYRLGLAKGWIPQDPRTARGHCVAQGVDPDPFTGYPSAWMTGGVGANTIAAAEVASYPWPPSKFVSMSTPAAALYQYTPTATPITMAMPTYTSATGTAGNGWFNTADDTRGAFTPIAGCAYPSEYSASAALGATICGANQVQPTKRSFSPAVAPAAPTPAPQ